MELGKGQKIPLNENFLTIKFERPDSALEIDTAAFLTDGRGKVAGDEDFVFYGNARHNSGAVTHNDDDSVEIDLSRIPRHVERISLTATIYDADKRRQNFSMIRNARLRIFGSRGEIATFPLENFSVETAIVLGEVYRYKGVWKFNAIGAGFSGGLAALCNNFGIEVSDVAPTLPQPERPKINTRRERPRNNRRTKNSASNRGCDNSQNDDRPQIDTRNERPDSNRSGINMGRDNSQNDDRPQIDTRNERPDSNRNGINMGRDISQNDERPQIDTRNERPDSNRSGINMGRDILCGTSPQPKKIELRKGQKISLAKKGNTLGEIVINLNWNKPAHSNGFFSRFLNRGINLDLACLFELKDGNIGAVQALGNHFGDLNHPPYIALDGDDRTGSVAGGETIRVNGKFADKIQRILIYTFIYEGAANWSKAKGVVTLNCPGSPELVVRMDEYGSNKHTCAIALLENIGGTFSVEKIIEFFEDSEQMDRAFDWGLIWTAAGKD